MKRSVKSSLVVCGLTAVMAVGFATPAGAVTIGLGGCEADGQSPTGAARVSNMSCQQVQARVRYIDSGGNLQYAWGAKTTGNSVATALTSMLVQRAGQGYRNGSWSGYITY